MPLSGEFKMTSDESNTFFRLIAMLAAHAMHINVNQIKSLCWCSIQGHLMNQFLSSMTVAKIPIYNSRWGQIQPLIIHVQPLLMAIFLFLVAPGASSDRLFVFLILSINNSSVEQNKRMLS